jgi:hypothetical protein
MPHTPASFQFGVVGRQLQADESFRVGVVIVIVIVIVWTRSTAGSFNTTKEEQGNGPQLRKAMYSHRSCIMTRHSFFVVLFIISLRFSFEIVVKIVVCVCFKNRFHSVSFDKRDVVQYPTGWLCQSFLRLVVL